MDTIAGRDGCRRLMVMMPPRHGKSVYCSHTLPTWYLGSHPNKRVILTSYNAEYAADWGRKCRTTIEEHGGKWFGTQVDQSSRAADRWGIRDNEGGMVTAGAGGTLTGRGADLLIVDDPVKNAEEAHSKLVRDKTWDWWVSTAYTRLEPNGAAVVIQTRWHQDDLCGRLLKDMQQGGERWRVLRLPAIYGDNQALWPTRFPIDNLLAIKRTLGSYYFSALYQQEPIPDGGEFFQRDKLVIVDALPAGCKRAVRYWDTASAVVGGGDYTCGVLMTEFDGVYYVADVVRGQWSDFGQRNRIMAQTAETDRLRWRDYQLWCEQEHGNSGKMVGQMMAREFAKYGMRFEVQDKSKELRARPFQAQVEAGNVRLVKASWNREYIEELISFPHGEHDDQVDPTSGAFNHLVQSQSNGGSFKPRFAKVF